jgi:large subunit ribosomal protein L32
MPVPKKRTSRTRRDKRRSHDRLTAPTVVSCPQCNEPRLPHRICPHCGYYKKTAIIEVE